LPVNYLFSVLDHYTSTESGIIIKRKQDRNIKLVVALVFSLVIQKTKHS